MHEEKSSVYCLHVHLQDKQTVNFDDDDDLEEIMDHDAIKKTALTEWFAANSTLVAAKEVTYLDFPPTLCLGKKDKKVEATESMRCHWEDVLCPPICRRALLSQIAIGQCQRG